MGVVIHKISLVKIAAQMVKSSGQMYICRFYTLTIYYQQLSPIHTTRGVWKKKGGGATRMTSSLGDFLLLIFYCISIGAIADPSNCTGCFKLLFFYSATDVSGKF